MKFVDKVAEIVAQAAAERDRLDAEQAKFEEDFRREEITGKRLTELRDANRRARDDSRLGALAELFALRAPYAAAARQGDTVDAGMLTPDARLLELDVPLTADQFAAIVERNADNVLMGGLIRRYAEAHPDEGYDVSVLRPDAAEKIRRFDDYVDLAEASVKDVRGLEIGFFRSGRYTPTVCTEEM